MKKKCENCDKPIQLPYYINIEKIMLKGCNIKTKMQMIKMNEKKHSFTAFFTNPLQIMKSGNIQNIITNNADHFVFFN